MPDNFLPTLRRLKDAATKGPWRTHEAFTTYMVKGDCECKIHKALTVFVMGSKSERKENDAELIVLLRNHADAIAALLLDTLC